MRFIPADGDVADTTLMMRFLTAAFGKSYLVAAHGLTRSFHRFSPEASLTVFTDLPGGFAFGDVVAMRYADLIAGLDSFYQNPLGQFQNVFRFLLLRRLREQFPDDDLCWIDADMLVFGDIGQHLVPGQLNVMAHGRRDDQVLDCGGGLIVSGNRYAIGGMFSLPPGPALDHLDRTLADLPGWDDGGGPLKNMADQLALNHLVARSGLPVNWISDDRRFIFNLEAADALHPVVGDAGLSQIALVNGRPWRTGRRIALMCWIKKKLDAHLKDNFSTFRPEVAALLRDLYAPSMP